MNQLIKIAVTGGPSGGKTTFLEALKKELGHKCTIVPEAASILYRGGFPRLKSEKALIHTQRAIYYTQKEIEELITQESHSHLIVCDRGSLDSIAYWPSTEEDFFNNIQSSKETELRRYDWVIHLDTASAQSYDSSNPLRTESYEEAALLNEKVKLAWAGHNQRFIIGHQQDFMSKMNCAMIIIKEIQSGRSYDEIKKSNHF